MEHYDGFTLIEGKVRVVHESRPCPRLSPYHIANSTVDFSGISEISGSQIGDAYLKPRSKAVQGRNDRACENPLSTHPSQTLDLHDSNHRISCRLSLCLCVYFTRKSPRDMPPSSLGLRKSRRNQSPLQHRACRGTVSGRAGYWRNFLVHLWKLGRAREELSDKQNLG